MVGLEVQPITAEQTWPLRHDVLRVGQPFETVKYPADHDAQTLHFGIVHPLESESPVGILSFYREPLVLQGPADLSAINVENIAWRLRGMAVDNDYQGKGIGGQLLRTAVQHLDAGIWCNARVNAVPYYQKNGFSVIGNEFTLPDIGRHYVMVLPDPGLY